MRSAGQMGAGDHETPTWPGCAPARSLPDCVVGSRHASDIILTRQPIKRLPNSCQMGQRAFPAASGPSMSSAPRPPPAATGPACPKSAPTIASPCPSRLFPVPPQRGSVDAGLGSNSSGTVSSDGNRIL